MSKRELIAACGFVSIVLVLVNVMPATAYVTPKIGGAQLTHLDAPMIMPEISLSGNNVVVMKMDMPWMTLTGTNRPVLRPLTGTDAFDPAAASYSALNGKAYNFQYGWAPDADLAAALVTAGGKIWIELTGQSPGLKTYDRDNSALPIFGTNGADNKIKFNEAVSMDHNYYAVTPGYADWYAIYNVYVGDTSTGAPISGYNGATVRFDWVSIPEPSTMTLMGMGIVYLFGSRRKK